MTPTIATVGSAGADLYAAEDITILPGQSAIVSTGYIYQLAYPTMVGLVKGRSGLAFKHDIVAFEGTIDSDYSGNEVKVKLFNLGTSPYEIKMGERVAQIVIVEGKTSMFFPTNDVERDGGFGSSGK